MSGILARASRIGTGHGQAAAGWVFDGNTSDETYRRVLAGIEDGDPAVLDSYRTPGLSGEHADDYTDRDLAADLDLDQDSDSLDDAASAYLDAASEAFWAEVERVAREHVVSRRASALRSAGFRVRFAYRPGESQSYILWHDLSEYAGDQAETYVDLSAVARSEDTAGQATTLDRSNFRSLIRDYPDTFTPVSYANVDALGAFVSDLTDDLTDVLTSLAEQYPVYDEGDLSELELEEISESWDQYVKHDIDVPADSSDAWNKLSDDAQREMFWSVLSDLDIYPEHDGLEIRWTDHYPAIAAELAKRLS